MYPALIHPDCTHLFQDQFAFRPNGFTTAALVSLIHKISSLLVEYPYVHVIAFDFSKAFHTVRHSTLLAKCADLLVEDAVYNYWLMSFLDYRTHCTKFTGCISCLRRINASIVEGSGIGPVTFVICASDLCPLQKSNSFDKYADDSYLIVPSVNSSTIAEELEHIAFFQKVEAVRAATSAADAEFTPCPKPCSFESFKSIFPEQVFSDR